MNRLNKTESTTFVSLMCFLVPEDLYSELISVTFLTKTIRENLLTSATGSVTKIYVHFTSLPPSIYNFEGIRVKLWLAIISANKS